ncbi:MAG: phosphoribosylformylglycinamidine synthase subunit PurL, partial [Proteobacteria bacterium]
TGGNVSFYNQNPDGPVNPTPTIGMVGLLEDIREKMTLDFKEEGDVIYLVGTATNDVHSSEYLHRIQKVKYSPAPYFELEEEYAFQQQLMSLIADKLVRSVHDVSEGGLFVTLCESGFNRELGFSILTNGGLRKDAFLFGEGQSRAVVTVALENVKAFEASVKIPFEKIGVVSSGEMVVDGDFWGTIDWWKEAYDTAIENYLKKEDAGSALSAI